MSRNPFLSPDSFSPPPDDGGWTEPIPPRRRSKVWLVILTFIVAMFAWESFKAQKIGDGRFKLLIEDTTAHAYGGTDTQSYADVQRVLDDNPQLERIVLHQVPGTKDMVTNTRIAEMIRARGIDTHLESSSYIASGGVSLFLAGEKRTMECGARIGVHSWQGEDGEQGFRRPDDRMRAFMEAFYTRLGIDPAFYEFARDSSPHQLVYILKKGDIERFDLLDGGSCEKVGIMGLFR